MNITNADELQVQAENFLITFSIQRSLIKEQINKFPHYAIFHRFHEGYFPRSLHNR